MPLPAQLDVDDAALAASVLYGKGDLLSLDAGLHVRPKSLPVGHRSAADGDNPVTHRHGAGPVGDPERPEARRFSAWPVT